jgi:hypothetical protein
MQSRHLLAVAALALSACDPATAPDPSMLSLADASALAPAYEELTSEEIAALGTPTFVMADGPAAAPVTTTIAFTRTRACPLGGSVQVQGTVVHTGDRQTRSASHQYAATRTEQGCVLPLRSGESITINGDPNTAVTGSWSVTDGTPGVRTITHRGGFTWARSGGGSGSCTVDLTATWDPATRTHRLQGTFCYRTVDVTRTRN